MTEHLRTLIREPAPARELALRGLDTVLGRHTCKNRVNELLNIVAELRPQLAAA
jgi:spore maturation protein CgeB